MDKVKVFEKEIEYIKDEEYKKNLKILIEGLPDYFFEIEASSTGKYHPSYALGNMGLVRHTKAAARIGHELFNDPCIGDKYTDKEKDLMLISLILHDGLKCGNPKERYTRFDHPILAADYVVGSKEKLSLTDEDINFIASAIRSHMGPWNTNPYSDIVLPVPKTKYENFVHMCDYLASRKFLEVPFDDNNNVIG